MVVKYSSLVMKNLNFLSLLSHLFYEEKMYASPSHSTKQGLIEFKHWCRNWRIRQINELARVLSSWGLPSRAMQK